MKTTSILISAVSLFAALSIAIPAPIPAAESVQLVISTGDGDASVGVSVKLDKVFSTAGQGGAKAGVAVKVNEKGTFCQAFSDNAATKTLGAVFTSDKTLSLSKTSSGGTESVLTDAVPIGAFLCSKSPANLPSAPSKGTQAVATARVQLEIESDTFVQVDVPANGTPFSDRRLDSGLVLGIAGAKDVDANKVSCRAFSDAAGRHQIVPGAATSAKDLILTKNRAQPLHIGSIVCRTT